MKQWAIVIYTNLYLTKLNENVTKVNNKAFNIQY